MKNKNLDLHPKKTYGKKGIKNKKTPNRPEDDKLWDEEHDHNTVLKGKSENIKTTSKQRITRKKTLNKLTSKTALEPASSSTVEENVQSEVDKLWDKLWEDETVSESPESFILKPLQLPPDYDFHDHNKCIAENLGLHYGVPIPGWYAKYFDDEAMVPVKPSCPSDSDSDTFSPFLWRAFKREPSKDDSPSPLSDGDLTDLESNDEPIDLRGPMTRSKKKEVDAALYKKMLAFESNPCESIKREFKRLDDLGF